jgi:outer membrane protein W
MFKKVVLVAGLLMVVAAPTLSAQDSKFRVTGLFGYTLSDGVSGDSVLLGDGNFYNQVDVKDGPNFGVSFGFMFDPKAEVGFMYRRQSSKLEIGGLGNERELGDAPIDSYHGYFTYYFGEPEAKVNPYLLVGLGATHYNSVTFTRPGLGGTATTGGNTQFSTTFSTGAMFNLNPNFGLKAGISWTPTYIKSDAAGYWCDPWYGCYLVGDSQYSNQFHFEGGFVIKF